MRSFQALFSLAVTCGLIYLFNTSFNVGGQSLPAFGKLLDPYKGAWQSAEHKNWAPEKELQLTGLKAPVKVVYDKRLVPHIFAENIEDLVFTQGYVTAQHRLWQMEFQTMAAAGRLSEIAGPNPSLLDYDKKQRKTGMLIAAERAIEAAKKDETVYPLLVSYSNGVNAYIQSLKPKDYPFEYKLMGFEPSEWTTLKTALLLKYMAAMLSSYDNDIEHNNALAVLGQEQFDFLFPEYFEEQLPIIPSSTSYDFEAKPVLQPDSVDLSIGEVLQVEPMEKPHPFLGSNNWAVSAKKSFTGNPLLCNDPHLRLTLPSIWYEIQLNAPGLNAYGVSLPGAPAVIIGFNEQIAWGATNVGHDVRDWYRIEWKDESHTEYRYDGQWRKAEKRKEVYLVKGGETVEEETTITHLGPVVYEDPKNPKYGMAFRWIAHESAPDEMSNFYKLNKARNYDDYREAIALHQSPAQNFIFASKGGDIALWVQGLLPLKYEQQGRFIQEGNTSSTNWQGFIPQEHNPHIKNPESGYIGSANQHSTHPDYPYYYLGSFDEYRGRTVYQNLAKKEQFTIKDMMAMQNNNTSLRAKEYTPLLLKHLDKSQVTDKVASQWLSKIQTWDYDFDKDEVAPIIFDEWYSRFYKNVWDEFYSLKDSIALPYPKPFRTFTLLRDHENSAYFDNKSTPEKETASMIVTRSFLETCDSMRSWESEGKMDLTWRNWKHTNIGHLARIPGLGAENINVGGHHSALNAISEHWGPSWRMIVELGTNMEAYGVYPGGQSGNPGSRYYSNFIDSWAAGEYYKLWFMKSANEQGDILSIQELKLK